MRLHARTCCARTCVFCVGLLGYKSGSVTVAHSLIKTSYIILLLQGCDLILSYVTHYALDNDTDIHTSMFVLTRFHTRTHTHTHTHAQTRTHKHS